MYESMIDSYYDMVDEWYFQNELIEPDYQNPAYYTASAITIEDDDLPF